MEVEVTVGFIFVGWLFPFIMGWLADVKWGDPQKGFHPIVCFGKAISFFERRFNNGSNRKMKGALMALLLVAVVFIMTEFVLLIGGFFVRVILSTFLVFYCLAGTTLIREVKAVFEAVDTSVEAGREQVGRIVGRDTSELSEKEIRTAALETLAENLSDGVVAPMFWFLILGVPGMMAYKMVNTLDSMIGYKNERYKDFGCVAARMDDVANWIPARLTAFLMLLSVGMLKKLGFVKRYGPQHAGPNAGYPEAALAAILDCRFGGTHNYFGKQVYKPFIGEHDRDFSMDDLLLAVRVNRRTEKIMAGLITAVHLLLYIALCV